MVLKITAEVFWSLNILEKKQKIVQILKSVCDPEIGVDIVKIGLIYDIVLDDFGVEIKLTFTSAACPMRDLILQEIYSNIKKEFPEIKIRLKVVWEPLWNQSFSEVY